MGVTIHFEGKIRDDEAYQEICKLAHVFAEEKNWPIELIDEQEVTLNRVKNEEDWNYVGPVKGLVMQPHENSDPLRLEFDKDLYVQEYIKTQFAPTECHIAITTLLRNLTPFFENLEVIDEAEYFETGNKAQLQHHLDRCFEMLDEYLENSEKYYGPVRLENGRIIDIMEQE